ncbi:PREDICTED: inactive peptidyl-prolyl cis-trans isomerase FKBP6 isoform X2 [Vollenhovia emeryi]|nr:PREDICTED: inactive peptidyl-prolyl cis-trans isomerase FKBP6 isoform X2 [Vollenhovia emeryi]
MLNMLNMNNFEDEEEEEEHDAGPSTIYGMSFSKLKSKMTSLTPDQKVMKFIKQNGVGEIIPQDAQVSVHYLGNLEYRDEPFDSTYSSGKPRTLRLNQNFILPGLEIAIRSMRKHEKSVFIIHPDLAYKAIGCPPRIPPNEEVAFIVHLIDYVDNGSALTYQDLNAEEKQSFNHVELPIIHMLATARDHFTKFNFKQAIREYRRAIDCLESVKLKDISEENRMNELLSRACTNVGICYNKEKLPFKACLALGRVPIPTAKSYYNFGIALLNIGEYDCAMKELRKALVLEPRNNSIQKAIQTTNAKQLKYREIERRLWQNCFRSNTEKKKVTEFRKAVSDLCENLIQSNDVLRQSLSEGFTREEYEIVREEAAIHGLNVVTSTRHGKETVYLQKNKP